ncbi:hypothetical protein NQ315_006578 [Exocentrus adspersus]|uniref:DDE Tnp4 domain-containing protein n=1 Tax=Exocentrus adspersus TaxID=1586481 RepID=A0AAV8VG62_9CUCU|nr:hypothetical protein NQ315_006578 [Exocentrus adspersus]
MEELIGIQGIQNVEIAEILNNRQGNRRANLNRRQDPFEILNELFRLSKQLVRDLLQILDPYIQGPSRDSALDKQAKVCDDQLRITNINARFPGSTHDAYIWSHSNVSEAVSNFNRQNPSYYLIGDSGYPLRPWLQTPIRDPPPGTPEYAYNTSFKRARSTVERCNGLLKMRFRCLLKHRVLHYAPSMCSKIINSCAVLHNMCLAANIPIPEEEGNENVDFGIIQEDLEPANPNRARQNPDLVRGRNIQQQVIQNYFITTSTKINVNDFNHGRSVPIGTLSPISRIGPQRRTSNVGNPYTGCRDAIRLAYLNRGVPESAIEVLVSSLADSTIKQYNSTYAKWWAFCKDGEVFKSDSNKIIEFLNTELQKGANYNTINQHRSALNTLLQLTDSPLVTRFMKGAFRIRPVFPRYNETWDPNPVLTYLNNLTPLASLTLEKLTYKFVVLLALISSQRVQTLTKVKLSNITYFEDKIEIKITDIIKTSAPGKCQPILTLPYFHENPNLCIATILKYYIDTTQQYRNSHDQLLITIKKPHHPASAQTVAKWIKKGLALGVLTQTFLNHIAPGTLQPLQPSKKALVLKALDARRGGVKSPALSINFIIDPYHKIKVLPNIY